MHSPAGGSAGAESLSWHSGILDHGTGHQYPSPHPMRRERGTTVRTILLLASSLVLAVAVAATFAPSAAQQKRWAAIDPNSETTPPVVWGASEEEARQRAIDACKRVSKTCANGPAVTDDMKEVFALVCCEKPRTG